MHTVGLHTEHTLSLWEEVCMLSTWPTSRDSWPSLMLKVILSSSPSSLVSLVPFLRLIPLLTCPTSPQPHSFPTLGLLSWHFVVQQTTPELSCQDSQPTCALNQGIERKKRNRFWAWFRQCVRAQFKQYEVAGGRPVQEKRFKSVRIELEKAWAWLQWRIFALLDWKTHWPEHPWVIHWLSIVLSQESLSACCLSHHLTFLLS